MLLLIFGDGARNSDRAGAPIGVCSAQRTRITQMDDVYKAFALIGFNTSKLDFAVNR
jgi:hypothetical protein